MVFKLEPYIVFRLYCMYESKYIIVQIILNNWNIDSDESNSGTDNDCGIPFDLSFCVVLLVELIQIYTYICIEKTYILHIHGRTSFRPRLKARIQCSTCQYQFVVRAAKKWLKFYVKNHRSFVQNNKQYIVQLSQIILCKSMWTVICSDCNKLYFICVPAYCSPFFDHLFSVGWVTCFLKYKFYI